MFSSITNLSLEWNIGMIKMSSQAHMPETKIEWGTCVCIYTNLVQIMDVLCGKYTLAASHFGYYPVVKFNVFPGILYSEFALTLRVGLEL